MVKTTTTIDNEKLNKALKDIQNRPIMTDMSECTIKPIKSPLDALDKLDHTLCLNVLNASLKFNLDEYHDGPFDTPIDCANVYEMMECIDIIRKALIEAVKPTPAPSNPVPCWPYDPITHPYVTWGTKNINITTNDPCDSCPNKGGPKDGLGNPIAGDSPCQWCPNNPMKIQ